MGSIKNYKILSKIKQNPDTLSNEIKNLRIFNKKLIEERRQQEKKIAILERRLHRIGEAEEQRDWLFGELTKKITTIIEIRSDLLKRERLSAIGELSSRLAHDMRNPLSIVLNSIDVIKLKHQEKLPRDVLKLFLMIDRATSRMAFQLDDVLNFVRQAPMEYESRLMVDIISASLNRIVIPNTVKINKPNNDCKIECDPRKLEAVFSNLIMNSIQAMENKGKIDIRIIEENEAVVIEIEDTGPGIPLTIMDKIFEPLFTTKSQGTGLGLASVKHIVEQHNGSVTVRLNPTVFSVNLPRQNHQKR